MQPSSLAHANRLIDDILSVSSMAFHSFRNFVAFRQSDNPVTGRLRCPVRRTDDVGKLHLGHPIFVATEIEYLWVYVARLRHDAAHIVKNRDARLLIDEQDRACITGFHVRQSPQQPARSHLGVHFVDEAGCTMVHHYYDWRGRLSASCARSQDNRADVSERNQ